LSVKKNPQVTAAIGVAKRFYPCKSQVLKVLRFWADNVHDAPKISRPLTTKYYSLFLFTSFHLRQTLIALLEYLSHKQIINND